MRMYRTAAVSALLLVSSPMVAVQAQGLFDASKYGIEWQSGLRYWASTGKHTYDLSDTSGKAQVARQTWDRIEGQAAETFFRADHWSGIFLKGHLGAGSLNNGTLNEEDFVPVASSNSSNSRICASYS